MKDAIDPPAAKLVPIAQPPSPVSVTTSSTPIDVSPGREKAGKGFNTKNLLPRLGSDALSAICAGAAVSPVISIIDRSIMENASGRASLSRSLLTSLRALVASPSSILLSRPTALIFMLYGSTYLTANTVDTVHSSFVKPSPASTVTAGPAKFAASSATNIGLCIYKDSVFVRMFGPPGATPRPVPPASYLLFAVRDCLTIFASFNVPPRLAPVLEKHVPVEIRRKLRADPATLAQFAAPASVQFLSTPLHLLGLELYNRPSRGVHPVTWRQRWDAVAGNWLVSSAARICRIIPAFGVGGVVNMKVRKNLMERLE